MSSSYTLKWTQQTAVCLLGSAAVRERFVLICCCCSLVKGKLWGLCFLVVEKGKKPGCSSAGAVINHEGHPGNAGTSHTTERETRRSICCLCRHSLFLCTQQLPDSQQAPYQWCEARTLHGRVAQDKEVQSGRFITWVHMNAGLKGSMSLTCTTQIYFKWI